MSRVHQPRSSSGIGSVTMSSEVARRTLGALDVIKGPRREEITIASPLDSRFLSKPTAPASTIDLGNHSVGQRSIWWRCCSELHVERLRKCRRSYAATLLPVVILVVIHGGSWSWDRKSKWSWMVEMEEKMEMRKEGMRVDVVRKRKENDPYMLFRWRSRTADRGDAHLLTRPKKAIHALVGSSTTSARIHQRLNIRGTDGA